MYRVLAQYGWRLRVLLDSRAPQTRPLTTLIVHKIKTNLYFIPSLLFSFFFLSQPTSISPPLNIQIALCFILFCSFFLIFEYSNENLKVKLIWKNFNKKIVISLFLNLRCEGKKYANFMVIFLYRFFFVIFWQFLWKFGFFRFWIFF